MNSIKIISERDLFHSNMQKSSIEELFHYFEEKVLIAVDTETTGLSAISNEILTLQLGDSECQFIIDAENFDFTILRDFFNNKDKLFLFQNAKFDLQFLYKYKIIPKFIYDTFLAESVLFKGDKFVRKSLDVLTLKYCSVRLDKSIRGLIFREGLTKRVLQYAADDVKYLDKIYRAQTKEINLKKLSNSLLLENMFVKVLAYIEYSGIYLDTDKWKLKIEFDKKKLSVLISDLNKWIVVNKKTKFIDQQLDLFNPELTSTINWASSHQVIPLFKDLGIDVVVKDGKTGKYKNSVDASIIKPQIKKSTILPIYLEYKKYEKSLSTYGDSFLKQINPKTNRIHTKFTQIMSTGRLSSGGKDKVNKVDYVNLQNVPAIPKEKEKGRVYERECFTAEEGNVLINADYSGQEQIVFANFCLDEDLLNFYKDNKGDMHSFIASKIYPEIQHLSLIEIKNIHPDKRQIAKSAGFAINYGGTGHTISENLGLTIEEGDAIYDAYFKAFPGIKQYFAKVKAHALKLGYILFNDITKSKSYIPYFEEYLKLEKQVNTPTFWAVYREEKNKESDLFIKELKPLVTSYFRKKGQIERSALNYPIQGSSAEITKIAGIYLFKYLQVQDLLFTVKFTNMVHDELMVECSKDLATTIAPQIKFAMEQAAVKFCKTIKLKADPVITDYWMH